MIPWPPWGLGHQQHTVQQQCNQPLPAVVSAEVVTVAVHVLGGRFIEQREGWWQLLPLRRLCPWTCCDGVVKLVASLLEYTFNT